MQKKLELTVPRSLVGGFNSLFQLPLHILSDFNSEEKYESWSIFAEIIVKIKRLLFWDAVYQHNLYIVSLVGSSRQFYQ